MIVGICIFFWVLSVSFAFWIGFKTGQNLNIDCDDFEV